MPLHAYPRYSTRALAQFLILSLAIQTQARQTEPKTPRILVVTNANDTSVSFPLIQKVVGLWNQHNMVGVQTYEFGAELGLEHDIIDPASPDQRIDIVYPKLMEIIAK